MSETEDVGRQLKELRAQVAELSNPKAPVDTIMHRGRLLPPAAREAERRQMEAARRRRESAEAQDRADADWRREHADELADVLERRQGLRAAMQAERDRHAAAIRDLERQEAELAPVEASLSLAPRPEPGTVAGVAYGDPPQPPRRKLRKSKAAERVA